jgi:phage terminase large subunit
VIEITFSDVYEPLFKLLEAKPVVESNTFKSLPQQEQEDWLKLSKVDTVLISGGRDSGKSFALSCFNPIAAKDYNHRILYTRQTMSSTDNSITEALEGRMELLGYLEHFEKSNKIYSVKDGIGKISITGQKTSSGNQTAKLKSLEDFSIFETDEGEELESFEGWNKVKRSMRAKDVQCLSIISFNPPTKEHWLYEEFYENVPEGFNGIIDNILYIHSTYKDNIDNMAEHNIREYEELEKAYNEYEALSGVEKETADKKLKKKWKQYKYEILGGFKEVADGVIYEDWDIGEFNDSLPYCYGIDFGFSDPDALTKVAVDHGQKLIYVKEMMYKNSLGTNQLGDALINIVGYGDLIIGDAAHKRLINDLYDKGLNIRRCKKGAGSVQRRIKTIQGYTIIVDPNSPNVVKSLNNHVWKDARAGIPEKNWKHIPDSFGYAAMELIEYN